MKYNTSDIPDGSVRLLKLAKEGRLSRGDVVGTKRLGACYVVEIHGLGTIDVRQPSGKRYRLTGLDFGAARMVQA